METPVFDVIRDHWPDKAAAWDLGQRPVRARCSDARALDTDTVIVALCEPQDYRLLSRQWHDQDTARNLDEALHQIELERAARPPVIEVTVTTPPGGITRTELNDLVREKVAQFTEAQFTGPQRAVAPRAASKVLTATRRARDYLMGDPPAAPPAAPSAASRVREDDTPTRDDLPVIREVQVP